MLAQVAVKKDEDSAPPPVPSNDGGKNKNPFLVSFSPIIPPVLSKDGG